MFASVSARISIATSRSQSSCEREPCRAERLFEVAVEACAIQRGGGRGHGGSGAGAPREAARRARTPERAARRRGRFRPPPAAGPPWRARAPRRRPEPRRGICTASCRSAVAGAAHDAGEPVLADQVGRELQSAAATAWRAPSSGWALRGVPAGRRAVKTRKLLRETGAEARRGAPRQTAGGSGPTCRSSPAPLRSHPPAPALRVRAGRRRRRSAPRPARRSAARRWTCGAGTRSVPSS